MAYMIPDKPKSCTSSSCEAEMFEALKQLDNDYYVFHSFEQRRVVKTSAGRQLIVSDEADFVILNQDKGILLIEAKAGNIQYRKRSWYYASGEKMDPIEQVERSKYSMIESFKALGAWGSKVLSRCKIRSCVWFPSIDHAQFERQTRFSPEVDANLFLTHEALLDPQAEIDRVFDYDYCVACGDSKKIMETHLTTEDMINLITKYFSPEICLVDQTEEQSLKNVRLVRMLDEQKKILDFIDGEPLVAICGEAGTGKTMLAVERARRLADDEHRVLFLCYNKGLRDALAKHQASPNVDYYNIGELVASWTGRYNDYEKFIEVLKNFKITQSFPYSHLVIDEGQDFGESFDNKGKQDVSYRRLLSLIYDAFLSKKDDAATTCIFYDKNQKIQGDAFSELSELICNADTKLHLSRNCRNTRSIAHTSSYALLKKGIRMMDGAADGDRPQIAFCDNSPQDIEKKLLERVDYYVKQKQIRPENIQILTVLSRKASLYSDILNAAENCVLEVGGYAIPLSTVRAFKGLEAEAVILIELEAKHFKKEIMHHVSNAHANAGRPDDGTTIGRKTDLYKQLFYVASSRAKSHFAAIANISDEACQEIVLEQLRFHADSHFVDDGDDALGGPDLCPVQNARDRFCELFGFDQI